MSWSVCEVEMFVLSATSRRCVRAGLLVGVLVEEAVMEGFNVEDLRNGHSVAGDRDV